MQIRFLRFVLDRSRRPGLAYGSDHGVGVLSHLDQQACGNRARPPQSALELNHDVAALAQFASLNRSYVDPCQFEIDVRRGHVDDRQGHPCDLVALRCRLHVRDRNAELAHLVVFREGYQGFHAPLPHGGDIGMKIAVPRPRHRIRLLLAGVEGDADASRGTGHGDGGDLQRMGAAGSH